MALSITPKATQKLLRRWRKRDVVGTCESSSGQLKGISLGKASQLTDTEVTRVILFRNIILQLVVSMHIVVAASFLDFQQVGHWL